MHCQHCDYLLFNLTQTTCPECGREFDVTAFAFAPGAVSFNCPHCDQEYFGNDEQGLPSPRTFACVGCHAEVTLAELRVVPKHANAVGSLVDQVPWDRREAIGWIRAWWESLKMVLFSPGTFFSRQSNRSLKEAWFFAVTNAYIGIIGYVLLVIMVMAIAKYVMISQGAAPIPIDKFMLFYAIGAIVAPPILPFFVGGGLACTTQLALVVLARDRLPFGCTLRMMMYAMAPYALYAVPVCGQYAAFVWFLVAAIIGVTKVHGISGSRAAIAVLWPVVLLFVFYAGGIALFILFAANA